MKGRGEGVFRLGIRLEGLVDHGHRCVIIITPFEGFAINFSFAAQLGMNSGHPIIIVNHGDVIADQCWVHEGIEVFGGERGGMALQAIVDPNEILLDDGFDLLKNGLHCSKSCFAIR